MEVLNEANNQNSEKEKQFAEYLLNKGYIKGPEKCQYGCAKFYIQKDSSNKNTGCIFLWENYKCRKKYSVRINSIFELFPYNSLFLLAYILT